MSETKETKEEKLKRELLALLAKYEVRIVEHDDYDGEENYCGSHHNIEGKDVYITLNELMQ